MSKQRIFIAGHRGDGRFCPSGGSSNSAVMWNWYYAPRDELNLLDSRAVHDFLCQRTY
ncbi:GDP-L-fucose synthetase [Escherichia coli]|uniref:GDP-L-fucose synthetase n=1 Tax=Escherichia coli TaxID=562 RepID=A0A2X1KHH7_ECOLX|nr:GDP-L-fucose synthetase [Escherichia coli]